MQDRLSAQEVFFRHPWPLASACGFIGVFVICVPAIYTLSLSTSLELTFFALLLAGCHLANWPMLQLRWRLWFRGRLTPYAAACTTALLTGSFGIPAFLLLRILQ